ncbi:hypothetical protein [Hellea balneolensis]|uniref:hypothetical protein n=1 Tax=Hellea balneolensis TaxID=287478 RepID=UPI00047E6777|nr:hypothetical protein [Hellea balneolensis]
MFEKRTKAIGRINIAQNSKNVPRNIHDPWLTVIMRQNRRGSKISIEKLAREALRSFDTGLKLWDTAIAKNKHEVIKTPKANMCVRGGKVTFPIE